MLYIRAYEYKRLLPQGMHLVGWWGGGGSQSHLRLHYYMYHATPSYPISPDLTALYSISLHLTLLYPTLPYPLPSAPLPLPLPPPTLLFPLIHLIGSHMASHRSRGALLRGQATNPFICILAAAARLLPLYRGIPLHGQAIPLINQNTSSKCRS